MVTILLLLGLFIGFSIGILVLSFKRVAYKGPNSNKIKKQIFTDADGTAFRLIPETYICPPSINIHDMEHSSSDETDDD